MVCGDHTGNNADRLHRRDDLAPVVTSTAVASATPPSAAGEQFTPVVMSVMSMPRWFAGTDGLTHLVYELELTNGFPVPVTVTTVGVRDTAGGEALQALSGDALKASMSPLAGQAKQATELAVSESRVVWMDVTLKAGARPPAGIDHTLTVSVPPGLPVPASITSTGGAIEVDQRAPTPIGAPLAGTGWIALPSCCDGPHRRSLQPIDNAFWLAQRFAIDFNKIDAEGMLASGDSSTNASWFTYDQPTRQSVNQALGRLARRGFVRVESPRVIRILDRDAIGTFIEGLDGRPSGSIPGT